MIKRTVSDKLTKLATIEQARERYKMSRATLMKLAKNYEALVKIGRIVRIDIERFDKGIEKEMEDANDK